MKAVIFDMDGVLIDSHAVANKLLCNTANQLGCNLTLEEIKGWGSLSSRQFWERVKQQYNISKSLDELIQLYDVEQEISYYKEIGLITGVREFLEDLSNNGIATALATSASRRRMDAVLDMFDIRRFFNLCLCDEDVSRSKPDPEIYETASRKLMILPNDCVVIEDSYYGMTAAKRAGMNCVGFKGLSHVDEDMAGCALIIYDFREINAAKLKAIGRSDFD